MSECPCPLFDEDPAMAILDVPYCACGHTIDEHDEWLECGGVVLDDEEIAYERSQDR
jgi:putative methionine-R-sulfoxide reductase with GAF domain